MINNKLIYFKTEQEYNKYKNTISPKSIVFIEDTRKIITHFTEYGFTRKETFIKDLQNSLKTINGNSLVGTGDIVVKDGDSAYEIWRKLPGNENKTEQEFLASLKELSTYDYKFSEIRPDKPVKNVIYAIPSEDKTYWTEEIWDGWRWIVVSKHDGTLNVDHVPYKDSESLITSGGVYEILYRTENVTDTQISIKPNILYIWGDVTSLDITFDISNIEDRISEYMIQFSTGDTIPNIKFPDYIKWLEEPLYEPNSIYQISIVNNLAIYALWEKLV